MWPHLFLLGLKAFVRRKIREHTVVFTLEFPTKRKQKGQGVFAKHVRFFFCIFVFSDSFFFVGVVFLFKL